MRALIFDVDGTLAETEELHRRAFNETFAAAGLAWHWTPADYGRLLKTTGGKERIARFMAETGASGVDIPALHAAKTDRYTRLMAEGGLALRPGVADLIARARARGVRLAVATTTSRPNVEALCRACLGGPAAAVFDVLACGDEVARKKPAPDVFLLALDRLGLPAADCLAFEDSRNGLDSARGAGLRCVVTPSAYTSTEDFAGAALVLRDLAAFPLED
ncbi:MAG: HAD family hydrolase [Gemmobacter sp.]